MSVAQAIYHKMVGIIETNKLQFMWGKKVTVKLSM